jgi:2-polyprenyl-3-methyl-5-hydroxy-6-metoxy-1,4-benzoquinol methylase
VRTDYFGESVAARYDASSAAMFDPAVVDPAADFLAVLAAGGDAEPSALEFGIGTGRIALPLSRRGVRVHGIDLSAAMVARLRAKPGGVAEDGVVRAPASLASGELSVSTRWHLRVAKSPMPGI